MAATLRLMRFGKKGEAFYRIVVLDKRKKRNGAYIEKVGTYNPLTEPATFDIDQEKFQAWRQKGAQLSEGLERLLRNKKLLKK